ncbi:2-isopropylmalate synthase [Streptomyces sp. SID13726]|uniref:2-isopropylmalate synthase n=1 Tax=Streptomyces sp. SID13726 TaxID=2706058 RepID=UPI0013B6DB36|nr:2-isopropylmalate synthase [Streptomyces sp. SID13726]NEB05752.1 2-isopropylmalate synthase [Streptomyces sp. SID13726]
MPFHRYRPYDQRVDVPVSDRGWPAARIDRAPLWVPVDLRDGNQALAEPMDTPRKSRFFDLLVRTGFKEIEVGYPSASRTDFDFVRHLVTSGAVPDDVTPVVFTPARADLIDRTFDSIAELPRAVVHLYIATSPVWRDVVLGRDRKEVWRTVRTAAERMARRAAPGTRFQFSPETFNLTEPDFVLELCDGLTELWDASPDRPVTHNLPATVEIATPNVYADQIEYLHRNLARRDSVILSVHPHNDRGTGVACAELAVLAGAQRVEGCLFGNGERTGNVDLVTLAMNLYAQGVDPMVDFGDIDAVRETVEHCNRLPVHPRHPYAGDLVYTAFSGTHQDAISKGLAHRERHPDEPWQVPYLPIDPADVGRTYEAVIRVNSQSGKGGTAYLLRTRHGIDLPVRMRPDFARVVQEATDTGGREITPGELYELFETTYLAEGDVRLHAWSSYEEAPGVHRFVCTLEAGDRVGDHEGTGGSPVSAFVDALAGAGHTVEIVDFTEQERKREREQEQERKREQEQEHGREGGTVAYAECRVDGRTAWGAGVGVGVGPSAGVRAVLSAMNRVTR